MLPDEEGRGLTVAAYSERWYTNHVLVSPKPRYHITCRSCLDRHLLPAFGRMVMAEVKRADVASFIAAKHREGLAQGTINRIVAVLSSIFSMAVRESETSGINGNPAARHGGARKPEIKGRAVRPADIYDDEQVATLLDYVERDPRFAQHSTLIWTFFYTGARIGEVFGLQPGDFDFRRGVVDVQRQVQWMRDRDVPRAAGRKVGQAKLHIHEPKHGPRLVEVPDEYLARVRNYIAGMDPRLTGSKPSPWLFPGPSDPARPWVPDIFRRYIWGPLLEAAGLPYLKPHGSRHSYGTNLLRATGEIHFVAQQLGH
jgi:integrase